MELLHNRELVGTPGGSQLKPSSYRARLCMVSVPMLMMLGGGSRNAMSSQSNFTQIIEYAPLVAIVAWSGCPLGGFRHYPAPSSDPLELSQTSRGLCMLPSRVARRVCAAVHFSNSNTRLVWAAWLHRKAVAGESLSPPGACLRASRAGSYCTCYIAFMCELPSPKSVNERPS